MPRNNKPGLPHHLAYIALSMLALLGMYALLRLALLLYNSEQIGTAPWLSFASAFANGLRFDLRLAAFAGMPLILAMCVPQWMLNRRWMQAWLVAFASLTLLFGIVELDFYREFNQRLNELVFQYLKEDPKTVMSMLWYGFPVVRHLLAWVVGSWLMVLLFRRIDFATRQPIESIGSRLSSIGDKWISRLAIMFICLFLAVLAVRGTLRQGSPLRWGDAFTTESMFANQLGLNGTLSLASAAMSQMSSQRDNIWKLSMPRQEAVETVRQMLLTDRDHLVDEQQAAVRREYHPPADKTLPVRNVVFILMESLAGHSVGALGAQGGITPYFDKLTEEGLLFTRFFSNGTHTHQGMFASFACFPNLPGFEYLMQQQESRNQFSGLPQLLAARQYDNVYVYNGDFAWDNQSGFFGKQGVTNFVGRYDFVNPVVFDPTWGVSDQDMFDRALIELDKKAAAGKPFYAMLQTLSNHTPYALPAKLPVEPVTGHGSLDQHLTAMRYADWALGQFFATARNSAYFKDTLFVIVGDHGFTGPEQMTEINLSRFNVPLLMIAPGIREKFGSRRDMVSTQVDIVPTIMGRLGGKTQHQCWGRDLLDLPSGDRGFGMVKPSGGDQSVAFIEDNRILIEARTKELRLYDYQVGADARATVIDDSAAAQKMKVKLDAFVQTATRSLLENTAGAAGVK